MGGQASLAESQAARLMFSVLGAGGRARRRLRLGIMIEAPGRPGTGVPDAELC